MKKFSFILILILSFGFTYAQSDSVAAVQMSAYRIAHTNVYQSAYIGFAASPSPQYNELKKLITYGNESSLNDLIFSHDNFIVKLYALQAYLKKGFTLTKKVEDLFSNNQTIISTMTGCIVSKETVASVYARIASQSTY